MTIKRVRLEYPDGGLGVVYIEQDEELADIREKTGAKVLDVEPSSTENMEMEQNAILMGFCNMEQIARNGVPAALRPLLAMMPPR